MADQLVDESSKTEKNIENLRKISVTSTENIPSEACNPTDSLEYGLPLLEVYKLAVKFYKEKEGKAVHFSYEDKLQLVAFSQQVMHGPLAEAILKLPPPGALDVVGKDRRVAWQKLGTLSADEARTGFVNLLGRKCALFSAYIEAHRREKKEQERLARESEVEKRELEEQKRVRAEEERILQERLDKEELIKRQIQQTLNAQTYEQFRSYAEQQFPGEPEKQGDLVKQLQEQHYIQYIQQLQASQRGDIFEKEKPQIVDKKEENEPNDNSEEDSMLAANMWTRSDIDAFKQSIVEAEGDGLVRVGHGETVTVRVPTQSAGSRLFWEFATDHYDIGFGLYFEYGTPSSDQVSVHISESEDDDEADDLDDELYEDSEGLRVSDLEAGTETVLSGRPLLTEIVPVFRRDCQSEVYAGSHKYPGQGVYLLKFDNSYSLWRSKTLYYRVYYTH